MPDLAELLRGARQGAGLTLQELAARTKIKVPTLEAMERGDFEQLPHGVFMRGFLRACARELHLDSDVVVGLYNLERGQREESAVPGPALASPDPLLAEPTALHRLWRPFVAVLAFLIVMLLLTRDRPNSGDGVAPRPVATTGTETPGDPKSVPTAPQMRDEPPTVGMRVVVRATDSLWLEATADGQRVIYRLMRAGEREEIAARTVVLLRAGDAAAMEYTIDGRPARPLGPPGAVRTVRITRDNALTFLR
jgi:cytoskeleton protein RodZ